MAAQFPYEDETWTPKDKFVPMENDDWRQRLRAFGEEDYVFQIALYLLIWGEANNIRFMPECICFIYQCALDYVGPDLERFYF